MRHIWLLSTAATAATLSFAVAGTAAAGGDPFSQPASTITKSGVISNPVTTTTTTSSDQYISAPQTVYTSHVQAGDATPVTVNHQPVLWNPLTQTAAAPATPQVQWNANGWPKPTPMVTPHYAPAPAPAPAPVAPTPQMAFQPVFFPTPQAPVMPAPQPQVVFEPTPEPAPEPTPEPAPEPTTVVALPEVEVAMPKPAYTGTYFSIKAAKVWADDFDVSFEDTTVAPTNVSTAKIDDGDGWGGSLAIGRRIDSAGTDSSIPAVRLELQGSRYRWDSAGGNFSPVANTYLINSAQTAATAVAGTQRTMTGVSKVEEELTAGFGNIIAELSKGSTRPYLGAGVGYGKRETEFTLTDGTAANNLTRKMEREGILFQAMAGVNFQMSENIGVELGYKYIHLPKYKRRALEIHESNVAATVTHYDSAEKNALHLFEGGFTIKY